MSEFRSKFCDYLFLNLNRVPESRFIMVLWHLRSSFHLSFRFRPSLEPRRCAKPHQGTAIFRKFKKRSVKFGHPRCIVLDIACYRECSQIWLSITQEARRAPLCYIVMKELQTHGWSSSSAASLFHLSTRFPCHHGASFLGQDHGVSRFSVPVSRCRHPGTRSSVHPWSE